MNSGFEACQEVKQHDKGTRKNEGVSSFCAAQSAAQVRVIAYHIACTGTHMSAGLREAHYIPFHCCEASFCQMGRVEIFSHHALTWGRLSMGALMLAMWMRAQV